MYNGEVQQVARQQFAQVPQLPKVQGMGEVFDRALNAGLNTLDKYSRIHDFGEQQRVEHEYRLNDLAMRKAMENGLTAKWGTKESFFNEDGSRNEDNIAAFTHKWQEANMGISKSLWRQDFIERDMSLLSERNDDLAATVDLRTSEAQLANQRRAFEANYALAVEQGDYAAAVNALQGAVDCGRLLPAEAKARNLQILRKMEKGRLADARARGPKGAAETIAALLAELGAEGAHAGVVGVPGGAEGARAAQGEDLTLDDGLVAEALDNGGGDALTLDGQRMGVLGERGQLRGPDAVSVQGTQVEAQHAVYEPVWTLEEAMQRGMGSVLTAAEYGEELGAGLAGCMAVQGAPDAGSGAMQWEAGIGAPMGVVVATQRANEQGGWTQEGYKKAGYSIGAAILANPAYKNLSDAKLRDLLTRSILVQGMGEELFAAEGMPEVANEAFVAGMVDRLMSTRNDGLRERVAEALKGGRGVAPIGALDTYRSAVDFARFVWGDMGEGPVVEGYEQIEDGELLVDGEPIYSYFVSQEGLEEFVLARVVDALGAYRLQGKEHWFEEQDIIQSELNKAADDYIKQGEHVAWAKFKYRKAKNDAFLKRKFEEEAKVWGPKVKAAQDAAEERKKAEAEAKKKAAAKPKKKTKEELLKERPYLSEAVCRFRHADNGVQQATLTVPVAEYRKMMEQFECGRDDVVYAKLDGHDVLVIPGEGDGWFVNTPAVVSMVNKSGKVDKAAVAPFVQGTARSMKLRRVRAVGK